MLHLYVVGLEASIKDTRTRQSKLVTLDMKDGEQHEEDAGTFQDFDRNFFF